jgi:hypothetical protein
LPIFMFFKAIGWDNNYQYEVLCKLPQAGL